MTSAQDWKPCNVGGSIHRDPRNELRARAQSASQQDGWVAVPIALALAVAELRECGARTFLTADEDGPLPRPQEIQCRRPDGHSHEHHNGYCGWSEAP